MIFNGNGGKGDYGWLQGDVICLNPILLSPVQERQTCLKNLEENDV